MKCFYDLKKAATTIAKKRDTSPNMVIGAINEAADNVVDLVANIDSVKDATEFLFAQMDSKDFGERVDEIDDNRAKLGDRLATMCRSIADIDDWFKMQMQGDTETYIRYYGSVDSLKDLLHGILDKLIREYVYYFSLRNAVARSHAKVEKPIAPLDANESEDQH